MSAIMASFFIPIFNPQFAQSRLPRHTHLNEEDALNEPYTTMNAVSQSDIPQSSSDFMQRITDLYGLFRYSGQTVSPCLDFARSARKAAYNLRLLTFRDILKSPVLHRVLDNSRLGMIGFDGDLFVAGKRAENVGSTRGCPLQKNKC